MAVINDRQGRWWRALECCARCAAAHSSAKIVATAPAAAGPVATRPHPAAGARAGTDRPAGAIGPHFSHAPSSTAPATQGVPVPQGCPLPAPQGPGAAVGTGRSRSGSCRTICTRSPCVTN
nr:hypothetical protein [Streptomyces microflavus]